MYKKGILGGTFDPIHNGHLHIAYEALYDLELDKILFIPSANPPHKTNRKVTDAFIRFNLVREAIKNEKKFELSDYELNKKSFSYTYKTLEYLNRKEKNTEWYFITGVDCLMNLHTWKNVDRIMDLCNFVVFSRNGYSKKEILHKKNEIEIKYRKKIIFLDIPIMEISSTKIRENLKHGKNISYLVPEKINKILKEKNLYK